MMVQRRGPVWTVPSNDDEESSAIRTEENIGFENKNSEMGRRTTLASMGLCGNNELACTPIYQISYRSLNLSRGALIGINANARSGLKRVIMEPRDNMGDVASSEISW